MSAYEENNTLDFELEDILFEMEKTEELNNSIIFKNFVEGAEDVEDIISENPESDDESDPVYDEFQMELNDGAFN